MEKGNKADIALVREDQDKEMMDVIIDIWNMFFLLVSSFNIAFEANYIESLILASTKTKNSFSSIISSIITVNLRTFTISYIVFKNYAFFIC